MVKARSRNVSKKVQIFVKAMDVLVPKFRKLQAVVEKTGMWWCEKECRKEFLAQNERFCVNERAVEYSFVFQSLTQASPKEVLDVGTGRTALPSLMAACGYLVTAIDNIYDYWVTGFHNRHFYVIDDDITSTRMSKKFDFITCISVLEHIAAHEKAVSSMFDILNPGGYLLLTHPYNESQYVPNVYALPQAGYGKSAPYICQVFSRKEINSWLSENNGKILEQEYWQIFDGEFWTFGNRIYPPARVNKNDKHQLSCLLIQKGA